MADVVAILDRGRIVRCAPTEELRDRVKRLVLPAGAGSAVGHLTGVLDVRHSARQVAVVVEDAAAAGAALRAGGFEPEVVDLNLDEIFEAYVVGQREDSHGAQPVLERVA